MTTRQASAHRNGEEGDAYRLPRSTQIRIALQRGVDRLLSPLSTVLVGIVLRVAFRATIEDIERIRRDYRRVADTPGPLMLCANHLTMIDSFLIGWALAGPWYYVRRFSRLAWNVPERSIFAANIPLRIFAYIYKCIPVVRGGERRDVARTLARVVHVLRAGETVLLFPEGGRSRSGKVELDAAAPGVGRIFRAVPGCRVLCVYLRGRGQQSYSNVPKRGERFRVVLRTFEPKSEEQGLRASRAIARQITQTLIEMEQTLT